MVNEWSTTLVLNSNYYNDDNYINYSTRPLINSLSQADACKCWKRICVIATVSDECPYSCCAVHSLAEEDRKVKEIEKYYQIQKPDGQQRPSQPRSVRELTEH